MRTLYQASPWKAATVSPVRSFAFKSHQAHRIGTPSDTFSPATFSPRRTGLGQAGAREPLEGRDLTVPFCLCEYMNSSMGQSCATPTAGGSGGSAEFGTDSMGESKGVGTIATVAIAGGAGVALLALLGVI